MVLTVLTERKNGQIGDAIAVFAEEFEFTFERPNS
jgi:hypothetical protein